MCTVCVITCVCTLCVLVYVLYVYCFRRTILLLCHKFIDRAEIPLGLLGMPRPSNFSSATGKWSIDWFSDCERLPNWTACRQSCRVTNSETRSKNPECGTLPSVAPWQAGPRPSWKQKRDFTPPPPRKVTRNLKMMVSNNLLSQGFIFRFHLSFEGCIVFHFPVELVEVLMWEEKIRITRILGKTWWQLVIQKLKQNEATVHVIFKKVEKSLWNILKPSKIKSHQVTLAWRISVNGAWNRLTIRWLAASFPNLSCPKPHPAPTLQLHTVDGSETRLTSVGR